MKLISIFSSFFLILVGYVSASFTGLDEQTLIEKIGHPIGFLQTSNKKILKYKDRTIILENSKVVETRKTPDLVNAQQLDVIIMDAGIVSGREPVGIVASSDSFIRGGKFERIAQENLGVPFISASGVNDYIDWQNEFIDDERLNNIRKVYLKFKVQEEEYTNAVLVLHTARKWEFDTSKRSPVINVYAVKEAYDLENRGSFSWDEHSLTWSNAIGNSRIHGADMGNSTRLISRSFVATASYGIKSREQLRFDLGNLSNYVQADGSVTLLISVCCDDRLDFISKDSDQSDWFKPRLLLK